MSHINARLTVRGRALLVENGTAAMIQARRQKVKIPDTVRHRTKWALALEMIDELASWGLRPPVAVADAGYGEITALRLGLTNRSIPYVLAVKSSTTAHPADRVPEKIETTGTSLLRPLPGQTLLVARARTGRMAPPAAPSDLA